MPTYKRPGIYIDEILTANDPVRSGSTSTAIFIGEHHRGPTDEATLVTSWSEFVSIFGGFPATGTPTELPYALYNYFNNGGRLAYVVRVSTAGQASATVSLQDRAGTPVNTLQVDARNPGDWGNDIRLDVVDRDAANGRFDLLVYSGGTTATYLVERWNDLSMADGDSRYVETIINSEVTGSAYIKVTDLDSGSTSPDDTPSVQTGTALTGGADGSAASEAEITAEVTAGTSLLDALDGSYTVNIPGNTSSANIAALLSYCEARGTFFAVLDTTAAADPATAVTYAAGLSSSGYGAVYYPWLNVPDPNSNAPGAIRLCPPGPFVLGKMAETDTARGVWKAPAGYETRLTNVVSLATKLSSTHLDNLNAGHVNAIRQIPGAGTVIMGARTLETATADKYVNVRRTLNYIKDTLTQSTEYAVFENNDEILWDRLSSTVSKFLGGIHQQGGLAGATPDQAFYVKCDGELNTEAVISNGEVKIEVGVALQRPAEFVVIRIGQWEGGQTAIEA